MGGEEGGEGGIGGEVGLIGEECGIEGEDGAEGWREALQLMNAGSKWQIVVPPALAYGERGAGTKIAPNSTLIFEVELVSIN